MPTHHHHHHLSTMMRKLGLHIIWFALYTVCPWLVAYQFSFATDLYVIIDARLTSNTQTSYMVTDNLFETNHSISSDGQLEVCLGTPGCPVVTNLGSALPSLRLLRMCGMLYFAVAVMRAVDTVPYLCNVFGLWRAYGQGTLLDTYAVIYAVLYLFQVILISLMMFALSTKPEVAGWVTVSAVPSVVWTALRFELVSCAFHFFGQSTIDKALFWYFTLAAHFVVTVLFLTSVPRMDVFSLQNEGWGVAYYTWASVGYYVACVALLFVLQQRSERYFTDCGMCVVGLDFALYTFTFFYGEEAATGTTFFRDGAMGGYVGGFNYTLSPNLFTFFLLFNKIQVYGDNHNLVQTALAACYIWHEVQNVGSEWATPTTTSLPSLEMLKSYVADDASDWHSCDGNTSDDSNEGGMTCFVHCSETGQEIPILLSPEASLGSLRHHITSAMKLDNTTRLRVYLDDVAMHGSNGVPLSDLAITEGTVLRTEVRQKRRYEVRRLYASVGLDEGDRSCTRLSPEQLGVVLQYAPPAVARRHLQANQRSAGEVLAAHGLRDDVMRLLMEYKHPTVLFAAEAMSGGEKSRLLAGLQVRELKRWLAGCGHLDTQMQLLELARRHGFVGEHKLVGDADDVEDVLFAVACGTPLNGMRRARTTIFSGSIAYLTTVATVAAVVYTHATNGLSPVLDDGSGPLFLAFLVPASLCVLIDALPDWTCGLIYALRTRMKSGK